MEAEADPGAGGQGASALTLVDPLAFQRPLIELERRALIGLRLVVSEPAGRGETVGAIIADVGLGGADLAEIRLGFGAAPLRHAHPAGGRVAGVGEELAD